ncbi:MAG: hypothetical protein AB8G86_28330 [Saprospiraceae bacterium]
MKNINLNMNKKTIPLSYEITHLYEDVNISKKELKRLLDIASWDNAMPTFPETGRTAWEVLQEPVSLKSNPSHQLLAAKFKGVGFYNPVSGRKFRSIISEDLKSQPIPPTTQSLDSRAFAHVGITEDGGFRFVWGSAAPIGGIVHKRAIQGFKVSSQLAKSKVPSIVPLAVIKYGNELNFNGEPMGAFIALSEGKSPLRASEVFYGEAVSAPGTNPITDAFYKEICKIYRTAYKPESEIARLRLKIKMAKTIGQSLKRFHSAGLYRHNNDWCNYQYSLETQNIAFTDLDSSQLVAANNLTPVQQTFEYLRDVGSAVYWLVEGLQYPTILDKYTLSNILKFNPIAAFLEGYFPLAEPKELRRLSEHFYHAFAPNWFLMKKRQAEMMLECWDYRRVRSLKLDKNFYCVYVIICLSPIMERFAPAKGYSGRTSEKILLQRAEKFLGDKYEYFLFLYNATKKMANAPIAMVS